MKKFPIIILPFFLLLGCSRGETTYTPPQTENVQQPVKKKIDWQNEITFTRCTTTRDFSQKDPERSMLEEAITKHPEVPGEPDGMYFGCFVHEYCTDDNGRYVFYASDKAPTSFGRYDKNTDVFEGAGYNWQFLTLIPFGASDTEGFGKRDGIKIDFSQKEVEYNQAIIRDFSFQKKENFQYCKNGLTPGGKRAHCTFDAYFSYDYIHNSVTERQICLFYEDDTGNRKALESCRENVQGDEGIVSPVTYIGPNLSSDAHYYISLSCTGTLAQAKMIETIPDDESVEVYMSKSCETKRLSSDILDVLTQKKFHRVSWFREKSSDVMLYEFNSKEVEKIGKAPWQYLEIENLSGNQYKLLRTIKNPYRIGFGPSTNFSMYTQSEREKCNKYKENASPDWNEEQWTIVKNEIDECLRNLPPLP